MKIIATICSILICAKLLAIVTNADYDPGFNIVNAIAEFADIPNTVSAIILHNRLYDTIFEVTVFTIAIMGVGYLLANESPVQKVYQFTDAPSIVLARLGATIATLVGIELAIRGHLSPGGGFAAGVAGGTAIGLVAITSSWAYMEKIYKRWRANALEKISVAIFIVLAVLSLGGMELVYGKFGDLFSGGWIPILNILVAVKVALGSWSAILLFIRYRGLL
ncbi:MAG: Na(+)/H(+) antiporter subunit B [Pseudanabaenaceae cyanobacterium SKYGB_i_bin29]|nr:Na(+)/H(+) antiporter subunit B [Pseudanabaenaceae cyanobacterium SKYG29]MDW8421788.1 Na(+)/H(+) antiporter subunit B [Pseudanabaenaceae cyanobacterium SKYGB_i_bin29]